MPLCTMCRSWILDLSAATKASARWSACFWLSPSRQILSPGWISASSSEVVSFDSTIFPLANFPPASSRDCRSCFCVCQSDIIEVVRVYSPPMVRADGQGVVFNQWMGSLVVLLAKQTQREFVISLLMPST